GFLLLWLLPPLLNAQPNEEVTPRPAPCHQSPTKVSCKGTGLRKFPEELGQGVKYLELSNNFIRNLSGGSVPAFRQLEYLDVCFNRLEAVSDSTLAQLPQLRSLLLGSNRLDRNYLANGRAFRLLRNIEVLDLSANNLESHMAGWYVGNLSTLRTLDLSGNKMTRLPAGIFRSAPRLRELDLSDNYITEIEEGAFEALEELEVVNLAMNSLHCISGFSLTQLRVLNLSRNALELFVWEEGEQPHLLQVLDLSHNRLRHFPELPAARHLTHLNLSNNLIASLLPGSRRPGELAPLYEETARFNGSLPTARGLTRVVELDLSNNRLQLFPLAFFQSLGSLRSLSLAMNCLRDVAAEPPERAALALRGLDLRSNAIRALPRWFFESLPQLETIDLGSNGLQPCAGQGSDRGRGSRGPAPGRTCTPFYAAPRLKHLSLRKNNITRLQPHAFSRTSLRSLDLSGNRELLLPRDALAGLELSLQTLSLRGNRMDDSTAQLPCLAALKVLDVSGNNLSLLPAGLFCSALESLDVRDNNLPALDRAALASWSRSLRNVSVAGNPFSCCSLAWLDA
ncbi:LRC32 protein, partial [Lophotis ruficrista]|nr:LRC32 protein [Lophotis ruficrista]